MPDDDPPILRLHRGDDEPDDDPQDHAPDTSRENAERVNFANAIPRPADRSGVTFDPDEAESLQETLETLHDALIDADTAPDAPKRRALTEIDALIQSKPTGPDAIANSPVWAALGACLPTDPHEAAEIYDLMGDVVSLVGEAEEGPTGLSGPGGFGVVGQDD